MLTVLRVLPFRQKLLQLLAAGTLSGLGILAGAVPSLGLDGVKFERAAYAQAVSDQEIQSYARSVLAIEPVRVAAYNQIKQMSGSNDVPVVACHRPSSLSNLPDSIRDIAVEYCNQAIAIVESNNLTITRFNQITVAHQSDASLSDRIQQAINRIQSGS
ncbi:MAG: DUF4168 domain-containing protein [Elainella sp.]